MTGQGNLSRKGGLAAEVRAAEFARQVPASMATESLADSAIGEFDTEAIFPVVPSLGLGSGQKTNANRDKSWSKMAGQMPAPVIVTNSGGRILFANEALCKLAGYRLDEIVGRDPRIFASGLTPGQVFKNMWRTVLAGDSWSGDVCNRRKDGSLYWVRLSVSHVQESQSSSYFFGVLQDITIEKEAQARAQELAEALRRQQGAETLGSFAGTIAHDVNNILAIISGFAHAGLNDLSADNPVCRDMQSILMAVDRGQELTKRVLALSRQGRTELGILDLGQAVADGLKLVRAAVPASISIRKKFASGRIVVRGDATEWHQIVTNLCVNAAQAIGDRPGAIEIELFRDAKPATKDPHSPGRFAELIVRDSGQGIAPDCLQRIFDPFFSTKKQIDGTGLGLAIVHAIVSRSGGRIWAENRPGGGAELHIRMPLISEADIKNPEASAIEGRQPTRGARPNAPSRKATPRKGLAALEPSSAPLA